MTSISCWASWSHVSLNLYYLIFVRLVRLEGPAWPDVGLPGDRVAGAAAPVAVLRGARSAALADLADRGPRRADPLLPRRLRRQRLVTPGTVLSLAPPPGDPQVDVPGPGRDGRRLSAEIAAVIERLARDEPR